MIAKEIHSGSGLSVQDCLFKPAPTRKIVFLERVAIKTANEIDEADARQQAFREVMK